MRLVSHIIGFASFILEQVVIRGLVWTALIVSLALFSQHAQIVAKKIRNLDQLQVLAPLMTEGLQR
jgi:hypothetical protein